MARTRGGGVISGASARSRGCISKPSLAGMRGRKIPLPFPDLPPAPATTGGTAMETSPGTSNTVARRARGWQTPPPSPISEVSGLGLTSQSSNSLMIGSRPRAIDTVGAGAAAEEGDGDGRRDGDDDGDDDDEFLHGFLDEVIGLDDDIAETITNYASVEMDTDFECSRKHPGRNANQTNSKRKAAERRSTLSPPKVPVWRMLYVDPDVTDPKLVAQLLENAASQALGWACVFDVAADIVEALADIRGDTMLVYRGVFINESLFRHKKVIQGDAPDKSIMGKHLSKFLREAGMSSARIVLLVAGNVDFDTADAGMHGLSAVLRKPFTKTGLIDILRCMYLSREPAPGAAAASSSNLGPAQISFHGQDGSRTPEGHPLAEAAAAAAAAAGTGPSTMNVGTPVLPPSQYPACLGFTPFTHPLINAYNLPLALLRSGKPQAWPRRRYANIAPREEDEAVDKSAPVLDDASPHDASAAADACAAAAAVVDRVVGQEL